MKNAMQSGHVLVLSLLFFTACGVISSSTTLSGEAGGAPLSASRDMGTHTFFLDAHPETVWFEMQQVFTAIGLHVATQEVGGERALLVSRRTALPPEAMHCGARPSGEVSLVEGVQGVVRAEMERVGATRTRVVFRVSAQAESIEENLRPQRSECVSRGTLERRIVERTEQRLG